MAYRIMPGYLEVPTDIGKLRFLRVETDSTLADYSGARPTESDIGGLSIECSMLSCYNGAILDPNSESGVYSILVGLPNLGLGFTIDNSTISAYRSGTDTSVLVRDTAITSPNFSSACLGFQSAYSDQISLPVIIKTADDRYIWATLWVPWSGLAIPDDYIYIENRCSFVLPANRRAGYYVGVTDAFFLGTTSCSFRGASDFAIQLRNGNINSLSLENYIKGISPSGIDPYELGGYSGTGGGGGGQNFTSVPIGRAPLPTLSFADTGFCRIYNPTLSQLQALANYMWTDDTFLQTLINHAKQLLEDPVEAIISLSLVPVPVPNGTAQEVKVLFIPTGVSMPPVTNQFVEVDCGTLSLPVEDQYGAALDFNPYTKIDLYLPYIGQVSIDVDEVMYKTMHCVYRVDVVTGMCVAIISVGTGTDETVLYQFAGHCGVQMPLNSADFSGWVGAIVTAAKTIGGLAAAGAGGAGPAAALIGGPSPSTSKTTRTTQGGGYSFQSSQTGRNPSTGRQITLGTESRARTNLPEVVTTTHETTPASFGELAARGTANTVDAIIGSKMHFEHAGSFSGNSGYIAGVRRPYAILKRPRQCYPENYASYRGFPAMIYMNLGDCTGYTEVHDIHLTGISATNPELGELAQLLKTGVIL